MDQQSHAGGATPPALPSRSTPLSLAFPSIALEYTPVPTYYPAIRHGDVLVTEQAAIFIYLADLFPPPASRPPSTIPCAGRICAGLSIMAPVWSLRSSTITSSGSLDRPGCRLMATTTQ
jgi:hypothetical protein